MNKCIFTTRFKECYKEKGYTQQKVADKLNISLNGLKHHLRTKNDNLPPLDLLKRMAELLDVDVAYLLGEIKCKRHTELTVFNATGLSQTSISYITKQSENYSWEFCRLIEIMARTPYLYDFLNVLDDYIEAVPTEIASINLEHKKSYVSTLDAKELLRAKAITLFDKILENIQSFSLSYGPDEIAHELIKKLLLMIDNEKDNYKNDYEPLYKRVEYHLEEINKINSFSYISLYSPKQIVHDKNERLKAIYFRE